MVAGLDGGHALTNRFDNTGTFMSEDDGECSFGVFSTEGVGVW
jgi:hypothetical protein